MMTTGTDGQQQFLRERRSFIAAWHSIGPLLIGALLVFLITMLVSAPMFLNPFAVVARLRADTLDIATLQTMAMMLPIVFVLLCMALLLLIFNTYRSCRREQQYLTLLDQLH